MLRIFLVILFTCTLYGCGGGGGGDGTSYSGGCTTYPFSQQSLSSADVSTIVQQAVNVTKTLNESSTIAVVDRVGNVLAVYQMNTTGSGYLTVADYNVTITSNTAIPSGNGLEQVSVDSKLAAITKAITGAYLSSSGNAFSTRTAGFIIQDHFIPTISNASSGPLYGVQFSQLACGDLVQKGSTIGAGPRASPLGLAADPGGFPLYKNGMVVGGIGVVTRGNPTYSIDLDPTNIDYSIPEIIAQSASTGYTPQDCIRADKITAGGVTLRYSDADSYLKTPSSTALSGGAYAAVSNFYTGAGVFAGTAYGTSSSGITADPSNTYTSQNGYVLVDSSGSQYRLNNTSSQSLPLPYITSPTSSLSDTQVKTLLQQGLNVANQTRAQIRRPLNSAAQVTISVVDAKGNTLGIARTQDAPIFGIDVSLQKARTAAFFSYEASTVYKNAGALSAYDNLNALNLLANYISSSSDSRHASVFFSPTFSFQSNYAFSARAIGNIHRPYFPDGINANSRGPLSAMTRWSPFNVGLQLDLVSSKITNISVNSCTSTSVGIDNGIQIFPGGMPIYNSAGVLLGAIGVSGDGVDQDDMIAFLAIDNSSSASVINAPLAIRSDNLAQTGTTNNLRYVQCPQGAFLNSNVVDACNGK